MPARLSSEGLLRDYKIPEYRYYPTALIPRGTRDWSRVRLLQACERLKIPKDRWPDFDKFILPAKEGHAYVKAPGFPAPSFDILRDTDTQWRERAERLFRRHCDSFLGKVSARIEGSVSKGDLTRIDRPHSASVLALRHEWAARRYCYNEPYKDLALKDHSPEAIRKAVAKIFEETGIRSRPKRK